MLLKIFLEKRTWSNPDLLTRIAHELHMHIESAVVADDTLDTADIRIGTHLNPGPREENVFAFFVHCAQECRSALERETALDAAVYVSMNAVELHAVTRKKENLTTRVMLIAISFRNRIGNEELLELHYGPGGEEAPEYATQHIDNAYERAVAHLTALSPRKKTDKASTRVFDALTQAILLGIVSGLSEPAPSSDTEPSETSPPRSLH